MLEWPQVKELILQRATERQIGPEYLSRLKTELKEVEKQGAINVWSKRYNENFKYETNKNGLVFPWLLDMTPADPIGTQTELKIGAELNEGVEGDAIILILEDGSEVTISPFTLVLTSQGFKAARALTIDDELS